MGPGQGRSHFGGRCYVYSLSDWAKSGIYGVFIFWLIFRIEQ